MRSASRSRTERAYPRPGALDLLNRRDVELQLDLLAHQQVAAAERLVEGHVPVVAVQLARDLERDALVAPRVGLLALNLGCEGDRLGHAVHRQLAGDLERLVVDRLDLRRLEAELRVLLDAEEVGRAKMLVAAGVAGVDRNALHVAVGLRGLVALADHERALEVLELATNRGDAEVLHREADARVGGINGPRACRDDVPLEVEIMFCCSLQKKTACISNYRTGGRVCPWQNPAGACTYLT